MFTCASWCGICQVTVNILKSELMLQTSACMCIYCIIICRALCVVVLRREHTWHPDRLRVCHSLAARPWPGRCPPGSRLPARALISPVRSRSEWYCIRCARGNEKQLMCDVFRYKLNPFGVRAIFVQPFIPRWRLFSVFRRSWAWPHLSWSYEARTWLTRWFTVRC